MIQRGLNRRKIFLDSKDREEFLCRLALGLQKTGHKCLGWVLMPNHIHLVIRVGAAPLSDLMRRLATGYALYFNKKYKRSGYLYQNRYKSILCQEETYLLELIRYIHLNPLRAKIVADMSQLNHYKWGGHAVLMGNRKIEWQSVDEILQRFGNNRREAVKKYVAFIAEAKDIAKREDLIGGGLIRSIGGWEEAQAFKRSKQRRMADERMLGDDEFVRDALKQADEEVERKHRLKKAGWDLSRIVKAVCKQMAIDENAIHRRGKGNAVAEARSLIAYFANKELGVSGAALARFFGISKSAITYAASRGEKIANERRIELFTYVP